MALFLEFIKSSVSCKRDINMTKACQFSFSDWFNLQFDEKKPRKFIQGFMKYQLFKTKILSMIKRKSRIVLSFNSGFDWHAIVFIRQDIKENRKSMPRHSSDQTTYLLIF